MANDSEGLMNYERVLHEMIVKKVKLIDKQLSGVRSIKTPLDQTHVYSIESKDRLAPFGVTMFLYRTIGDGRNTGVLRVLILTMSSELLKKR